MAKFKVLKLLKKDTANKVWDVINTEFDYLPNGLSGEKLPLSFLIQEGYIEEYNPIKPKYKVWDKVVIESHTGIYYSLIYEVYISSSGAEYNSDHDGRNWFEENEFRKPTKEELSLYYNK